MYFFSVTLDKLVLFFFVLLLLYYKSTKKKKQNKNTTLQALRSLRLLRLPPIVRDQLDGEDDTR